MPSPNDLVPNTNITYQQVADAGNIDINYILAQPPAGVVLMANQYGLDPNNTARNTGDPGYSITPISGTADTTGLENFSALGLTTVDPSIQVDPVQGATDMLGRAAAEGSAGGTGLTYQQVADAQGRPVGELLAEANALSGEERARWIEGQAQTAGIWEPPDTGATLPSLSSLDITKEGSAAQNFFTNPDNPINPLAPALQAGEAIDENVISPIGDWVEEKSDDAGDFLRENAASGGGGEGGAGGSPAENALKDKIYGQISDVLDAPAPTMYGGQFTPDANINQTGGEQSLLDASNYISNFLEDDYSNIYNQMSDTSGINLTGQQVTPNITPGTVDTRVSPINVGDTNQVNLTGPAIDPTQALNRAMSGEVNPELESLLDLAGGKSTRGFKDVSSQLTSDFARDIMPQLDELKNLSKTSARDFLEQIMPELRSSSQMAGQYGGTRGDISSGIASGRMAEEIARQTGNFARQADLGAGSLGQRLSTQAGDVGEALAEINAATVGGATESALDRMTTGANIAGGYSNVRSGLDLQADTTNLSTAIDDADRALRGDIFNVGTETSNIDRILQGDLANADISASNLDRVLRGDIATQDAISSSLRDAADTGRSMVDMSTIPGQIQTDVGDRQYARDQDRINEAIQRHNYDQESVYANLERATKLLGMTPGQIADLPEPEFNRFMGMISGGTLGASVGGPWGAVIGGAAGAFAPELGLG